MLSEHSVKIRRGKRTDFPALLALLPPANQAETHKAHLRHWRRLASDPRHDFYVAEQKGALLGLVLVCYVRSLRHEGWQAILDVVVSPLSEDTVGQDLLAFAKARARKRGCQQVLFYVPRQRTQDESALLAHAGFHSAGEMLSCELF
jgi:N-acetylglutamate synthase-like GNAT family acetyltransferase